MTEHQLRSRYQVRSTNFAPGLRYSVLDGYHDEILRTYSTREEAELYLDTFISLAVSYEAFSAVTSCT